MLRLLDRLAKKMVKDIDRLVIVEPTVDSDDFEGIHSKVWIDSNQTAMDRIDAKAGSPLTHISMMLAAATFMISAADTSNLEQVIIGFEIVAYLFVALLCIRCLGFIDTPGPQHQRIAPVQNELRIEVRRRANILNISIRWMFLITFVFMISVLAHIFL